MGQETVQHQKQDHQIKVLAVAILTEAAAQKIILRSQAIAKAKTALQERLKIKTKEDGCVYNLQ